MYSQANSIRVNPLDFAKDTMSNPKKRREFVRHNQLNLIVYFSALVALMVVYHFLSDKDFSFLMTMGSFIRFCGFCLLAFKLYSQDAGSEVSLKTLQLYAVVFAARLSSILVYEGYLPYDKSGDHVYPLLEILSLILVGCLGAFTVSKRGYNPTQDGFGNTKFGALFLAIPGLVLAALFHPNLNRNFLTDVAWTFGLYLETVAIIPQFFMIQKAKKAVEPWLSHFCFCLGVSRVCLAMFWMTTASELGGWSGTTVLVAQVAHVAVMSEFCYYYLVAAAKQTEMILPGNVV
jgi:hypothetical protein